LQDLELPPEVVQAPTHAAETAVFAAPTPGVSASQRWLQKGNLAAQHAAAGAFDSAMRLLNRCPCRRHALLPSLPMMMHVLKALPQRC